MLSKFWTESMVLEMDTEICAMGTGHVMDAIEIALLSFEFPQSFLGADGFAVTLIFHFH